MYDVFWRTNQFHHNTMVPGHQWQQENSNFTRKKPKKDMNSTKNTRNSKQTLIKIRL